MNVSFKGIYLYSGSGLDVHNMTENKHQDIPTAHANFHIDKDYNVGDIYIDGQDAKEVLKRANLGLDNEFIENIPTEKPDFKEVCKKVNRGIKNMPTPESVFDEEEYLHGLLESSWQDLVSKYNDTLRGHGDIFNIRKFVYQDKSDPVSYTPERKYEKEILKYVKERINNHDGKDASGKKIDVNNDKLNFFKKIKNGQTEKWL